MCIHAKQNLAKGRNAGSDVTGIYCSFRRASHSFTISPATTGQMVRRQRPTLAGGNRPKLSSLSRNSQTGTVTRTADAVGQVGELPGVVQHFHTLGVGVVAHRERLRDGRRKFPAEQADGDRKKQNSHSLHLLQSSLTREPTSLSLWHSRSCWQQSKPAGTL